ncbi:hypothetical protein NGRA_0224 [Nosema granulosis]|uniref:Uncharacterized protein n=1 Tax=Nosema granulosis TaxID=83296 RepID=A0A9P6H0Q7_9MICR|nr:hypothetical protein NGRA_0224 [Nosema granulosis]
MKDDKQAKKMKVIANLNKKMDTVKQEMYNAQRYRQKSRNLVDFEKNPRMCEYKHFVRPVAPKKSTLEARKKIRILYEYLWEVRIIPINKILRDSRKIVLYSEWLYFYREIEISSKGSEILRDCKKKNMIVLREESLQANEKELKTIIGRLLTAHRANLEIVKRLNKDVKDHFNRTRLIFPEGVNLGKKNNPSAPIFLKKPKEEENPKKKPPSYTSVEKYKQFLNTFKRCESTKSNFYKFTKTFNANTLHQSFINCLKRIPVSRYDCKGVKEICMSYIPPFTPQPENDENVLRLVENKTQEFKFPESVQEVYDRRIALKYKIEYIDLYLGEIDPEAIISTNDTVFYPFAGIKPEK